MKFRHHIARPGTERGFAALTMVMVLFFIMALVAAYTNRNLIFEQRIAANNYRSSKALNGTDAGIDWTVAMLNGGRINDKCLPSSDANDSDFRRRYLQDINNPVKPSEVGAYRCAWGSCGTFGQGVRPACIIRNGVTSCTCPTTASPDPDLTLPDDGLGTTFRVTMTIPQLSFTTSPGAVGVFVRGCANPGDSSTGCFVRDDSVDMKVDSVSMATAALGLVRALPIPPNAALTAGNAIKATGGVLNVANADTATGLTVHAPDIPITAPAASNFRGPAGSGSDGQAVDSQLKTLRGADATPSDAWFNSMFGMPAATFKRQPAVVVCDANCDQAKLVTLMASYPRNPIWIEGDLDLSSAGNLGTTGDPLMLIVTGKVTLSARVNIVGFVHANNIVWGAGAQNATMDGAMVAATDFASSVTATITYNQAVLSTISLRYGSFVRVPGSWDVVFSPRP